MWRLHRWGKPTSGPGCSPRLVQLAVASAWPGLAADYGHQVRRIARYRANTRLGSAAHVHELQQWVEANGGKAGGVQVVNLNGRDGGSGWGLTAAQDVSAGACLIELPLSCHLTYGVTPDAGAAASRSSAGDDPRLLALHQKIPEELWGAKLALQVLASRIRGDASPFAAYVRHLPVGVLGLPMFFSREAIGALEYPPVVEQVKKRGRWLADFARQELAGLPGTDRDPFDGVVVDINALGWALGVVTSRAFRTRGPSQPAAMLPLIDMANHSFDPNCEVLPSGSGVVMVAKRKVAAGEPLLLSYGKLSNDFLLLDYGFVCEDNPHDRVALRFEPGLLQMGALMANVGDYHGEDMDLQSKSWKGRLLERLTLTGPGANTEVLLGSPQHVDPRLVAAARVMAAAESSELKGRDLASLGDLSKPLSTLASEAAALRSLVGMAAVVLGSGTFTTSLDADVALLAGRKAGDQGGQADGGPGDAGVGEGQGDRAGASGRDVAADVELSEDMRLAVRFRMEKKKVLMRVVQEVGQMAAAAVKKAAGKGGGGKPGGKGFGAAIKSKS